MTLFFILGTINTLIFHNNNSSILSFIVVVQYNGPLNFEFQLANMIRLLPGRSVLLLTTRTGTPDKSLSCSRLLNMVLLLWNRSPPLLSTTNTNPAKNHINKVINNIRDGHRVLISYLSWKELQNVNTCNYEYQCKLINLYTSQYM